MGCVGGNGTIAANDCRKRPVREIVGITADLCKLLSARRNAIKPRYEELVADFQLAHDHEPTTSEQFSLSQRAAFDTREARPEPSSPAQQRAHWRNHATTYLGGQAKLDAMLADTLTARERPGVEITPDWIQSQAAAVIETISKSHARPGNETTCSPKLKEVCAQKEQPSILGSRSPSPTPHSKNPTAFRVRDQRIDAFTQRKCSTCPKTRTCLPNRVSGSPARTTARSASVRSNLPAKPHIRFRRIRREVASLRRLGPRF
ncbi:relaxase domain-containing protein [Mycobacterium marinum]|uniref:relaxase domain-containing protein n=1 Tax=Mycobacterium marinum TaxID=1781 RepID=UPI003B42CC5C